MKNKTTPAPAVKPHKYTAEEFLEEYKELCKRTGFNIVFEPRWSQSKDTGDYRLVIASGVVLMPTENNNGGN